MISTPPCQYHLSICRQDADAIVTFNEINDKHGVGVLLERVFQYHPNLITIRSRDQYRGEQAFGDAALRIAHGNVSRDVIYSNVLNSLGDHTVRRLLCIPFRADDVWNALAIRDICGASLCAYLMDDQTIYAAGIPDQLMRELLDKSILRLAISPEMADAYQQRFHRKIHVVPPLAPEHLLLKEPVTPPELSTNAGLIVGNIWQQEWLDSLRRVIRESGLTIRWYCNNSHFHYIQGDDQSLRADSITINRRPIAEEDLIKSLREASYTVVPSGTLTDDDPTQPLARLSLPSRITFILATSHTPIIVLGSERTAAARFVQKLGIGTACPYDAEAFRSTVEWICRPEINRSLRVRAAAVADHFTDKGAAAWIWQSLERGEPLDDRYEKSLTQAMNRKSA